MRPFLIPVVWAVIIAVAVHPVYRSLRRILGERSRAAAAIMILAGLVVLIAPTVLLGGTVAEGAQLLASDVREGKLEIPAPPETIRGWPIVGEPLYDRWLDVTEDLESALRAIRPQLVALGKWMLSAAAGAGFTFLLSVLSIVIAGVILANDASAARAMRAIARRIAGDRGTEFATLAGATVRSVAQGILGVALIQSFLAGLGFLVVGIPGAGLWALLGLFFCVVQIGLLPVTLPAVIYVFATAEPVTAVVFTIWTLAVSLIDNVLKPLLLGRGVRVPTVVIFLGSIGGFLTEGIIGLFVGAVVLVLGYRLFQAWLEPETAAADALESG
jgi:predicted PurR-regulated permease PerM